MSNHYEAVYSYAATINNLNPPAYAALFSATSAVHSPVGTAPFAGPEGAARYLEQFVPHLQSIRFRPGKIRNNGSHAAFEWVLEATSKTGRQVTAEGLDVIVYNAEGLIERVYGYWEPAPFLAAITAL